MVYLNPMECAYLYGLYSVKEKANINRITKKILISIQEEFSKYDTNKDGHLDDTWTSLEVKFDEFIPNKIVKAVKYNLEKNDWKECHFDHKSDVSIFCIMNPLSYIKE